MNRRLVSALALIPAAVLALSACEFEGTATGNGSVTPPTTSAPVGVPGPTGTVDPDPTGTTDPTDTESPTATTEPTTPATTTSPVSVPGPGDEDFVELDCADFPLEDENGDLIDAQTVFNQNRLDIHGLDADGDGTACEDTDPAANANDGVADSIDESNEDAADVAVAPEGEQAGLTIDVRSY